MNQQVLNIMEIERFSIHDGPGIRSTVFLQGCPLHCLWCANPESQKIEEQLMYYRNKCVGCGQCASVCKNNAIVMREGLPVFYREKCKKCHACENNCLQDAIAFVGEKRTVDSIVEEVLRDKDYYDNSGGGITISGGEAFVQFEAFLELIKKCKENGLHVAVETCGHVPIEHIKEALPYIDLFLFDLKHVEPNKFKKYTGGNIEIILKNIRYISSVDPEKIVLRVPVIPDFNYDDATIDAIFEEAKRDGIKEVHLLPYHTLGMAKYERLGRTYEMQCQTSLSKEDLAKYRVLGTEKGLYIKIGG